MARSQVCACASFSHGGPTRWAQCPREGQLDSSTGGQSLLGAAGFPSEVPTEWGCTSPWGAGVLGSAGAGAVPGALGTGLRSACQAGARRDLGLFFSTSLLFCPVSVLVPLIRSTKEETKCKEEVPQTGGEENFETWKNPPAQPHRKAKIRRRQPLSPSLLQPGDPCRPPEAAQFSESPRKRPRWSCAPAAKQKETCKTDSC